MPGNPTGKLLVDAEYCTQARRSLEIYEDFKDLVGLHVRNPARNFKFLETENPARDVLRKHDVDTSQNFAQFFPDTMIAKLETAMRTAIGPLHLCFSKEEILDGLTSPEEPVVGYAFSLPSLRSRMSSYLSDCTTDDDLMRAVRHPEGPLVVIAHPEFKWWPMKALRAVRGNASPAKSSGDGSPRIWAATGCCLTSFCQAAGSPYRFPGRLRLGVGDHRTK